MVGSSECGTTHLCIDIFDELVKVLIPSVSILILEIGAHGHDYVIRLEERCLQVQNEHNCFLISDHHP